MATHPTSPLSPFAPDVWIATRPGHRFLGLELGTRMTVVRLGESLLVHSPIALDPVLKSAIDALGTVEHVVAPNLYHHVYAAEHQRAWPDAIVHAPATLAKKCPDLRVGRDLDAAAPGWGDGLSAHAIEGTMLEETVLVHAPSRTLISADLIENFVRMEHVPTRLYLKAAGIWQKPGFSTFLRPTFRDRRRARRSIDALLERDWDRIVLAHGEPIETGAKDALRESYRWLRG